MAWSALSSTDTVRQWFYQSGVEAPLRTCIGPLPSSQAALGRWTCDQPDQRIHKHVPHPGSYRLVLMLAPLEARIWHDGEAIWGGTIAPSRFRICTPNENGSWSRASSCDIVNLFIPQAYVEQIAARRGDAQATILSSSMFVFDKVVNDLIHHMLDAQTLAGVLAAPVCDSAVFMLVSYLLEHYSKPLTFEEPVGLAGPALQKALRYIDQHLQTLPSNAELAEVCGMSEAHFSREFRRSMGLPPHQYMMRKRLEFARDRLLQKEQRIIEIAHEFGFNDSSHFSRSFFQQFGMTPMQYRRRRFSCI